MPTMSALKEGLQRLRELTRRHGLSRKNAVTKTKKETNKAQYAEVQQTTKASAAETESERVQPEAYVPTGAPWRQDSAVDSSMSWRKRLERRKRANSCAEDSRTELLKDTPHRTMDGELESSLRHMLIQHRQVQRCEVDVQRKLEDIDGEVLELQEKMQILDAGYADLEKKGKEGSAEMSILVEEATKKQHRLEQLEEIRGTIVEEFNAGYENMRAQQQLSTSAVDKLLVARGLIQAHRMEDGAEGGNSVETHRQRPGPGGHDQQTTDTSSNGDKTPERPLQHKDSTSNLQRSRPESSSNAMEPPKVEPFKAMLEVAIATSAAHKRVNKPDPQAEALCNYEFFRLVLGQADHDFEIREEKYEESIVAWERKRTTCDSDVESSLAFDHRHFEKTRKLTRALIKAEDCFEDAKAQAVAAGVDLKEVEDDDLESGFVDDVQDGYRISLEQEMVNCTPKEHILKWLSKITTCEGEQQASTASTRGAKGCTVRRECSTSATLVSDDSWANFSDAGTDGDDFWEASSVLGEGSDSWSVRSIEFGEGVSVYAEGPPRRWIDKWRKTPGLASR